MFKKPKDYQGYIKEIVTELSMLSRVTKNEELKSHLDKQILFIKNDPISSADKDVLKNLDLVLIDVKNLIENINLNKKLYDTESQIQEILRYLQDPIYGTYYPASLGGKLSPFDLAEKSIREKLRGIEDQIAESLKETAYTQRQAKEMFEEMKTLNSKSLRFKNLHMQLKSIDTNNKRSESRMKVLYSNQENFRFLLDLITTLRDSNLTPNSESTKEVMKMVKRLADNVNQPNFRELVTKLGVQVRTATANVLENENFFAGLSDQIFDQTIEVGDNTNYDSILEDEDEDMLEKIKSQFPMLED